MALNDKIYEYPSTLSREAKIELYKQYFLLIKESAYLGHRDAQYEYGLQFEDVSFWGMNNPNYNPKRCVFWFTKACDQNQAEACNNLANFYEKGEGCERDINKALELFKKSADLGYEIAKENYELLIKQLKLGIDSI